MLKTLNFLILLLLIGQFSSHAQQLTIKGIVTDSLQNPLASTNIIAVAKTENVALEMSMTNNLYIVNSLLKCFIKR